MIFIACVIGMALLTLFFGEVEERQFNPNQNPSSLVNAQVTEVRLERNRYGHYVVTGTINNLPVDFLLDTGATDVVIPLDLGSQLGLTKGIAGKASTANGTITVYNTVIDKLTVGDISLYKVNASLNPAMGKGEGILLGMSALKEIDFIQRGDSLTLRQSQF